MGHVTPGRGAGVTARWCSALSTRRPAAPRLALRCSDTATFLVSDTAPLYLVLLRELSRPLEHPFLQVCLVKTGKYSGPDSNITSSG